MNYFLNLCRNKLDIFIYNLKAEDGKAGGSIFVTLLVFLVLVVAFIFRDEIFGFISDFVGDIAETVYEESGAESIMENSDFTS